MLLLPTNNKHENDEDNSIAYGMCHGGSVALDDKITIKQIKKEILVLYAKEL